MHIQNKNNWLEVSLKDILVSLESGKRPKGGVSLFGDNYPVRFGDNYLDRLNDM
jgi:hypothetical protein